MRIAVLLVVVSITSVLVVRSQDDNASDPKSSAAGDSKSSEDEALKPPRYRVALERVVHNTLYGSIRLGGIESTDEERDEGLKAIIAAEAALKEPPDHKKVIAQLKKSNRAWADARSGPVKDRTVNLLDMDEQDAIAELELLEESLRTCIRQIARSGKQAVDRHLTPEDRVTAALDVQKWSEDLAILYMNFWVHYAPGLFTYMTGIEEAVEPDVYRGGFTTDYCKLKRDVFETVGGGVSAKLMPPTDHEKDKHDRKYLIEEGIPPTIDAYQKDPQSWPRIRRVVPAGTALEINLMVWRSHVTNAYLDIYAIPVGKDVPRRQRLLNIGNLCDWKDYPYTRAPKPEYLMVCERSDILPDELDLEALLDKIREEQNDAARGIRNAAEENVLDQVDVKSDDEASPKKITIPEAKSMLLRFVRESDVAKGAAFIRQSLPILESTEMTELESGDYVCGPWQVDHRENRATLTTDVNPPAGFQLVADFAFEDGKWRITHTEIIRIRP